MDAVTAAELLSMKLCHLLELARAGRVLDNPLYPGTHGIWRFRLSNLSASLCSRGKSNS